MHGRVAKEQWHGRAWRENPLFTLDRVTTPSNIIVSLGQTWLYADKDGDEQLGMITGIALDEASNDATVFVRQCERSDPPRQRRHKRVRRSSSMTPRAARRFDQV